MHDDLLRAVTKINPIATWTDDDVATYTAMHELPGPSADRSRLPVDRLLAVHTTRRPATIRVPAGGPERPRPSAGCT